MQLLLIALSVVILFVLYRLLRQNKTYTYTRATVISYQPNGTEYITTTDETGMITVTHNMVKIDGTGYFYNTMDSHRAEAILHYSKGKLRSVNIILPIGEKSYFIPDAKPQRRSKRRAAKMA